MKLLISSIDPDSGERVTIERDATPAEEAELALATADQAIATVAVVSARQIRLALLRIGLLPAATTWIAGADEATRIEWEYATELRRDHPMWSAAAAALGKTEADIDNLFALAATL